MVVLDNSIGYSERSRILVPRLTLPLTIALLVLCVGLSGLAMRGFSENGLRFGTQMVWRLNMVLFFAALVVGPAGRLIPPLRVLADKGRPLLQGFCAAMGVYFAFIILPNLFAVPDGVESRGVTAGMSIFVFFTGSVTLVMASALNNRLCERVGESACRAMLGLSAIFFWLCYSLIGLAHITGPHRHDAFYETSVLLMVVGLLTRFADRFFQRRRNALA